MRVVEDEEKLALLAGGDWFGHPLCDKAPGYGQEDIMAEIEKAQADIHALEMQHEEEQKDELQDKKRGRPSKGNEA